MAKDKTKRKDKKKTIPVANLRTYADGQPLDKITYLEATLILKPDRFTSVQSFRDFGKIVKQTTKKLGVGFIADPHANQRPEIRDHLRRYSRLPPLQQRVYSAAANYLRGRVSRRRSGNRLQISTS